MKTYERSTRGECTESGRSSSDDAHEEVMAGPGRTPETSRRSRARRRGVSSWSEPPPDERAATGKTAAGLARNSEIAENRRARGRHPIAFDMIQAG